MSLAESFAKWANLPGPEVFQGWEFVPLEQSGTVRAIAAMMGSEIHFAIDPQYRYHVIARHRAREFLRPLIERRGYLTTRMVKGGDPSFIERMGFKRTWANEHFDYFMMTELPFGKEN